MNPSLESQLSFDLQERPHTIQIATNTHNPQSVIFTNSTATTQPISNTIYSHQPVFSTLICLGATRVLQSILTPPLINQSACINSTASSSFILPLSNPPIPSNLSASSVTSFPSTQSMYPIDLTINATRMPLHQRLTLPSTSTSQFSAHPYNIDEAMHTLYPPTPYSLTTVIETRDVHSPHSYPHAIPYNPTLTQLYMQETDYHFQTLH